MPGLLFAAAMTQPSVTTIYHYYEEHSGLLIAQANMIDPDNCGRNDLYILWQGHPHYKEITAMILAAHFAKKPIHFYISGCIEGLPAIKHAYSYQ